MSRLLRHSSGILRAQKAKLPTSNRKLEHSYPQRHIPSNEMDAILILAQESLTEPTCHELPVCQVTTYACSMPEIGVHPAAHRQLRRLGSASDFKAAGRSTCCCWSSVVSEGSCGAKPWICTD